MAAKKHAGRVLISSDLLVNALHMPITTRILGAEYEASRNVVCLLVEDESLEPLIEGASPPLYSPTITHTRESFDWDWGKPVVER